MSEYKSVVVSKGRGGWGGPLTVTPTDDRPLVASITGGGIHPVAQKIAVVELPTVNPANPRSTRLSTSAAARYRSSRPFSSSCG